MVDSSITTAEISYGNDYFSEMSLSRSWLVAFEFVPESARQFIRDERFQTVCPGT